MKNVVVDILISDLPVVEDVFYVIAGRVDEDAGVVPRARLDFNALVD